MSSSNEFSQGVEGYKTRLLKQGVWHGASGWSREIARKSFPPLHETISDTGKEPRPRGFRKFQHGHHRPHTVQPSLRPNGQTYVITEREIHLPCFAGSIPGTGGAFGTKIAFVKTTAPRDKRRIRL
ncbi:MAG: hypothetical protein AABW86_00685 [Candidatus Micrarchaeota archaeon]